MKCKTCKEPLVYAKLPTGELVLQHYATAATPCAALELDTTRSMEQRIAEQAIDVIRDLGDGYTDLPRWRWIKRWRIRKRYLKAAKVARWACRNDLCDPWGNIYMRGLQCALEAGAFCGLREF